MKNTESLRKNREFLKLYRSGKFFVGRKLVLYVKENRMQINRLGISTARNFGNSVERNRIRRLIRENYRELEETLPFPGRQTYLISTFSDEDWYWEAQR